MSGINGIYRMDGNPADPSELRRMTDRLAHRGPDDAGIWHDGPVGLGHRMLWTTPESLHEHLPLASSDGRRVITADARVDNREELITTLNITTPPEQLTDSQLILHAYERWGESCPEHLLGDFAFAIWDAERQHLFCARDHMGVKPLYYYRSDTLFAFASEIKALLCLDEVPREVDERAVAYHLVDYYDDRAITSYKGISRLPAAHTSIVNANDLRCRQYWSLDPARELRFDTNEDYEHAFRELFTEAVRCRLRSAFPVGSLLSGGLDSSSVTCVARDLIIRERLLPASGRLHTFSAVFDEVPECDERPYINAVLAGGDLEPHFVYLGACNPLSDIEHRLWHDDEIGFDPNMFIMWPPYLAAQKAGVRVLMDGVPGDTVISYGVGCLAELTRAGKVLTVFREARGISRHWHIPLREVFWQQVILRMAPPRLRYTWRRRRGYGNAYAGDLQFIRTECVHRYGLAALIEPREEARWTLNTARDLHCLSLSWGAREKFFESLDKVAAALGLEFRHPFLDRRLVEFCLALPPEQKIRGGYTRAILRYALASYLPREVRERAGKADLDLVFEYHVRTFGRKDIDALLSRRQKTIKRYVNLAVLRDKYEQFAQGKRGAADFIWRAIVLANWLDAAPSVL